VTIDNLASGKDISWCGAQKSAKITGLLSQGDPVMPEAVDKNRPKFGVMRYRDILHVRMPVPAYVSILHRASGILLFVALPFILYLLEQSLTSELSFEYFQDLTSHWFVKLVILALAWGYLHHFCAGFRHMQMDFDIGLDLPTARKTSTAVFVVSLLLTALVGLKLFGAF
jgi:succinate dehydrogenase / fumarate reductase cytochrome b subunit